MVGRRGRRRAAQDAARERARRNEPAVYHIFDDVGGALAGDSLLIDAWARTRIEAGEVTVGGFRVPTGDDLYSQLMNGEPQDGEEECS